MSKPHHTPPFKLGHSERQLLLSSEGLPSAGRVTNVWADKEGMLHGTGEHVPKPLLNAINNKGYSQLSAEIYDNPPAEIKEAIAKAGSKGRVLRAVAILGDELPRVKSIKDLPELFKETGAFKEPLEIFRAGIKNDEGYVYTKEDMQDIARNFHILKEAGIDPSKFSEKAQFVTLFYEPPQGAKGMNADAIKKMLIEGGLAPEIVNGMDDTTLLKFVDLCKSMSTDSSEEDDEEAKKKAAETKAAEEEAAKNKTATASYAELEKKMQATITKQFADLWSKFAENDKSLKGAADEARKVAADAVKQIRLSSFSEIVSKATASGMPPAIAADGKLAFIAEALVGASGLRKFGEEEKTAYQVFCEMVATLPLHIPKKGEKGELTGKDDAKKFSEHEKDELDKVEETYSKYSETFIGQGTTLDELKKAFKTQLKANPKLTAREFLPLD